MRISEDVLGSFISSNKIGYRRSEDHVNADGGICFRVKEPGDKKTNYGEFDPGSG